MNVKKNVLVVIAVVALIAGAAGAINISMSYAKNYDTITDKQAPTEEEKKVEEEYLTKKVTYDKEHGWGVLYEEGEI